MANAPEGDAWGGGGLQRFFCPWRSRWWWRNICRMENVQNAFSRFFPAEEPANGKRAAEITNFSASLRGFCFSLSDFDPLHHKPKKRAARARFLP